MNENFDLTPKGVVPDFARVERAIRAKDDAGWALLNQLTELLDIYPDEIRQVLFWREGDMVRLDEIKEARKRLADAQEEFLRAVAGRSSLAAESVLGRFHEEGLTTTGLILETLTLPD
jgi:hypothetical protein